MKTVTELLEHFADASARHAEASLAADSNMANRCYLQIADAVAELKNGDSLAALSILLHDERVGVRLWAASYLLPVGEAVQVLEEIRNGSGMFAFDADMTLREWRKKYGSDRPN